MLYQGWSYSRHFSFLRRAPLPSFRGGGDGPSGPCGRRWIRTTEVERQQIYSLPHLATLVSARMLKNRLPSGETASGECRDVFLPSLSGDGECTCNALVGSAGQLLGGHKSKDFSFSILQKGGAILPEDLFTFALGRSSRRRFPLQERISLRPAAGCRCGQTNAEHYEKRF